MTHTTSTQSRLTRTDKLLSAVSEKLQLERDRSRSPSVESDSPLICIPGRPSRQKRVGGEDQGKLPVRAEKRAKLSDVGRGVMPTASDADYPPYPITVIDISDMFRKRDLPAAIGARSRLSVDEGPDGLCAPAERPGEVVEGGRKSANSVAIEGEQLSDIDFGDEPTIEDIMKATSGLVDPTLTISNATLIFLRRRVEHLANLLREERQASAEHTQTIDAAAEAICDLQKKNAELQKSSAALSAALAASDEVSRESAVEIKALRESKHSARKQAQKEAEKAEKKLKEMRQDRDETHIRVEQLERERGRIEATRDRLIAKNERLDKALEALGNRVVTIEEEVTGSAARTEQEAKRRLDAEAGLKVERKAKTDAERKLRVVMEAYEIEKEAYVARIRSLSAPKGGEGPESVESERVQAGGGGSR